MEIKEVLKNRLEGETLANALGFVDYLLEKGLTPVKEWDSGFRFVKNDKSPCLVVLLENEQGAGDWFICDLPVAAEPEWNLLCDDLKKFITANMKICSVHEGKPCGCGSEPGVSKKIFGKAYDNVCTSEIQFVFPKPEILDKLKEVIEWWLVNIAA